MIFLLGSKLAGLPIVTLASGNKIAIIKTPIIDPANLEVTALLCITMAKHQQTLACRDIREVSPQMLLVNSEDDFTDLGEVVRLEPLLTKPYHLVGATVRTEAGTKLGKVSDYTVNSQGWVVQKIFVRQSQLKGLFNGNLAIDRAQIIDVTPHHITVRDTTVTEPVAGMQPATPK